jgi:hypothetical protein
MFLEWGWGPLDANADGPEEWTSDYPLRLLRDGTRCHTV